MTPKTSWTKTVPTPTEGFISKHLDVRARSGIEWQCLCPFHNDTSPSLSVNIKDGVFICFACGAKGTVSDIAAHLQVGNVVVTKEREDDRISRLRKEVAELASEPPRASLVYPDEWLGRFDHQTDYWASRGFSEQVQRAFQLGYDPLRNHAVIPLRNQHGGVVGVIRRQLDDGAHPRYLYPRGFKISRHLFGAHVAPHHDALAVVAGSRDCVACWDAGVPAVALLGSRLSQHQADLLGILGPYFIVAFTDRDEAGRNAAQQLVDMFGSRVSVPEYPAHWVGKDPADLTPAQRLEMAGVASIMLETAYGQ